MRAKNENSIGLSLGLYSYYWILLLTFQYQIFACCRLDDLEKLRAQDKDTINRQNQTLADYESELNMLRRRVNGLEQDLGYEKGENKRLQEELFKTVQERDMERLNNIDLQNQLQAMQEEMEFLKNVIFYWFRNPKDF